MSVFTWQHLAVLTKYIDFQHVLKLVEQLWVSYKAVEERQSYRGQEQWILAMFVTVNICDETNCVIY